MPIPPTDESAGFLGTFFIENTETVQKWLDFETRLKAQYQAGYVPPQVYLYVDENDRIIDMIDFRHPLTDFLYRYGGNIGYSIRTSFQ